MSWRSNPEKGGLKGGFKASKFGIQIQAPLSSLSPAQISKRHNRKLLPKKQQLNAELQNSSCIASPSNEVKVATIAAGSSSTLLSSPSAQDCINSALKLQLNSKPEQNRRFGADDAADNVSEQIANDVQRILQDTVNFVPARNPQNGLLFKIQEKCTDISKIPLVKFSLNGKSVRSFQYSGMGEKGPELSNENNRVLATQNSGPSSSISRTPSPSKPQQNGSPSKQLLHQNENPSKQQLSPSKQRSEDKLPDPKFNFFDEKHVQMEWPKNTFSSPCGLYNRGNTCFLNATIQCLAHTAPLQNFFLSKQHRDNCKLSQQSFCINCELEKFLPRMLNQTSNAITPEGIISHIRVFAKGLIIGRQEDAHEFLRHVTEAMRKSALHGHNVKSDPWSQETTFVSRIFGGYYRSRVTCMKCRQPSSTYDSFLDIPIDIGKNTSSLEDALKAFTKVEHLNNPGNLYQCENCKSFTPATKQLTIYKAPNILTFQLKRFSGGGNLFSKIDKPIEFPPKLDLSPYLSSPETGKVEYQLYAVLVHSGISCYSGHYFSYVKSVNGRWLRTDDSNVSEASIGTVLNQRAYLLFYAKVSPTSSAGSRPLSGTTIKLFSPMNKNVKPELPKAGVFSQSLFSADPAKSSVNVTRPPLASNSTQNQLRNQLDKPVPSVVKPRIIPPGSMVPRSVTVKTVASRPAVLKPPVQDDGKPKQLVPYGDDDEEPKPPEPTSSNSSTSSQGSLKENKESYASRNATICASNALGMLQRDSLSPGEEPGELSPSPEVPNKPTNSLHIPSEISGLQHDTSTSTTGRISLVKDLPGEVISSPETRSGVDTPNAEPVSYPMSKAEKRRLKKQRRKQQASREGLETSCGRTSTSVDSETSADRQKRKKKKKRDKKRKHLLNTGFDSPVPRASSVHWIEKETVSTPPVRNSSPCDPQPEPVKPVLFHSPGKPHNNDWNVTSAYGTEVKSWDGGKSVLDQVNDNERYERKKREFERDTYDDECDEGHRKKLKEYNVEQRHSFHGDQNRFQKYQNAKNRNSRSSSVGPHSSRPHHTHTHRHGSGNR